MSDFPCCDQMTHHESEDGFTPFEVVLRFDYPAPPITANRSYHWRAKGRLTKDIRTATALLARRLPPLGKCRVSLVWVVTDRRRRDGGENVTPTMKPMIDGLVDAGVVTDDTGDLVVRESPTVKWIPKTEDVAHMELTITKLPTNGVSK